MDRLELLERLAALSGDLTPERGVASEQLGELRELLARDLITARASSRVSGAPERLDLTGLAPDLRSALEHAADLASKQPIDALEANVQVARRTLPFQSALASGSLAD
jgi:hypothetical protein